MSPPSASIRIWAQQLLAIEAANPSASETHVHDVMRVSEKLRLALTRFVGADGFTALLRRALALARTDVPALQSVRVAANGSLEGINEMAADPEASAEAATAITAHLLGLLVTFIGESLTLRLLRDAWPGAPLKE